MGEVRNTGLDEMTYRYPSEINMFDMPPLSNTYTSEDYVDYKPRSIGSTISTGSCLEYDIPATISQFTSLKETRHHIRVRIVHEDGTKIDDPAEICGPVNWPGVSFFESCLISLNQQLVSCTGGQDHGYRAVIQALLDRHRSDKDTILQAGLYFPDTPGHMDDFEEVKTGFMERFQYFAMSESVDLSAPIISDLSEQHKLIPNNMQISVKFWPAKSSFCLLTANKEKTYKFEILDAFLRVKRKTPQPAILLGITDGLELTPAKFPFMKTEMKKFLIHAGTFSFSQENLFESQVPNCMVITFVKAAAAAGNVHLNPYNFITAGVSSIRVYQDDRPVTPGFNVQYARSFLQSEYLTAFESLYQSTSEDDDASSRYCGISREDYARGYTLYVVRFSSNGREKFLPVQNQANLRIVVEFREAVEENVQMILYARFPSLMTIDKTRRVAL